MACLHPIHINNHAKEIYAVGTPFDLEVPCGKCSECKKQMQSEYYLRAHYQALDTIRQGGYVYFDTLTYDNAHLPHISDFVPSIKGSLVDHPCFNVDHYRKFFVRLRRALTYHGFDAKHNLKYFLCSEYGTDPTKTHRPHYHVLFYVTDPHLDSLTLSKFVSDSWSYGRTDGVEYRGNQYVRNHTFSASGDTNYMRNICNYVAKYVTKNSSFEQTIENRIRLVIDRVQPSKAKEFRKKLKREMCEFHRQSQGFGIYGLQCNDLDEMFRTGMMQMTDSKHIVTHIPMPLYFQRKLFYDLTKDFRGKNIWKLNEKGIEYRLNRLDENIERTAVKFKQWYDNILTNVDGDAVQVDDMFDTTHNLIYDLFLGKDAAQYHKDYVDRLLDGRTWKDFAEYILVYKGRFKSVEQIHRELEENKYYVDEKTDFFRKACTKSEALTDTLYNYSCPSDINRFGSAFISEVPIDEDDEVADAQIKVLKYRGKIHSIGEARYELCIDEHSDPKFENFDQLYKIYIHTLYYEQKRKDKVFNAKEEFKQIFNRFKVS